MEKSEIKKRLDDARRIGVASGVLMGLLWGRADVLDDREKSMIREALDGLKQINQGGQRAMTSRAKAKTDLRNAEAMARDAWLETEGAKISCNPESLGAQEAQRQYLTNRLVDAFLAGYAAAQKSRSEEGK